MSNKFVIRDVIPERRSFPLSGSLIDERGQFLPLSVLQTLTLTVTAPELPGQPIVNDLYQVDILNANQGKVSAVGKVDILLNPDDNVFKGTRYEGPELHRLLIAWTYVVPGNATVQSGAQEIDIYIDNTVKVG